MPTKSLKLLLILSYETLLLLIRDRVVIPVLIGSVLISIFANLASDWSVEDFTKILFDIGYFGFSLTGSLIAIFWGTKILSDSRLEGSVEVQLAHPIPRSIWLLGKFGGLKSCLFLIALAFGVVWQLLMLSNSFGWMTLQQVLLFIFMYLSWLILAAMATLFATLTGQATATFASLALWLIGLSSLAVSRALSPDTPAFTRRVVESLARIWNLQEMNLMPLVLQKGALTGQEWAHLSFRAMYGISLVLVFLVTASLSFRKKDLS